MFSNVLKHYSVNGFPEEQNNLRISYHHLVQRSRPTSSEVQTCYFWGALLIFAHIVLNIFELCPIHICCPNTCAPLFLGHSPLGQELSWKTEIWQLRVYFKPETFQTGKRGERGQNKSNWQGNRNCPNFVTFTMLSGGKRNPGFCPTCPWFHTKGLSGLLNVGASEAELMHPVGLGSMGWGWKWGVGREEGEPWVPMRSGLPQGRTM